MTNAKKISELEEKLTKAKYRLTLLRSALNRYASGFNYNRGHRDIITLNDEGEYAWEILLKELVLSLDQNDFDRDFVLDIIYGKYDSPSSIRQYIINHPNCKELCSWEPPKRSSLQ